MVAAMKLAFALLAAPAAAAANEASPIGKVMQLIADLQAKIVAEGEGAHKTYAEFSEWCEERSKNLQYEIKTGKAEVAELTASIDQGTAKISQLNAKLEDLAADTSKNQADLDAAIKLRAEESADFAKEEKELNEIISMLERAIAILEREMAKSGTSAVQLKSAGSMADALQVLVQASALSSADASQLNSFLQDNDAGAPAASVYSGQSGGIIATMEDLLDKAKNQLAEARGKETSALHNFEMLKQSLEDEIKYAAKEMAEAKQGLAATGEQKATDEGDLKATSKELKEDTSVLADLHHNCLTTAQDYEAETKSRGEELKALATAKQAIAENTAGADKLSYNLNQVSLLQSSSLRSSTDLANFEAVRYVRDLARKEKSTALSQLAARMSSAMGSRSGDDPFAKVRGLISDMIERLESEAQADASEKAYCDRNLADANTKKDDKTAEIEKLSTKIDQMTSRSMQLKSEVAALQKALADLAKAQAEMDKIRSDEKALYTKSKAEMEQGLQGVKMALKVLREYYAKDKSHSAAEGAGSSIIGLIEVCESDFSQGLVEMTSTEDAAKNSYEDETKENEIEKTTKEQDVKYKSKEASDLDTAVAEATSDRSGVQEELDAVLAYLKTLEKRCIAKAETYEERKARFESELAGLKEALKILEGEAVLLQKKSLRRIAPHQG